MTRDRWQAVAFGAAVQVARFAVLMLALAVGPLVGITGWYLGLFATGACVLFAVILVTARRLWGTSGVLVAWRGPRALLLLIPFVIEVLLWVIPAGLTDRPPGFGLWASSLLLVGVNEELVSRVVVLERMRASFSPVAAVAVTAALFGLQHLSAFATTDRGAWDVVSNVFVSAFYGFALGAFQYRFQWVIPLILLHAAADFTTILSARPLTDLAIAATAIGFIVLGVVILAGISPGFLRRKMRRRR